jgi:hypothetical protein
MWIDYQVSNDDAASVWSTGPTKGPNCWFQGLRLLPGISTKAGASVKVKATADFDQFSLDANVVFF